MRTLNGQATNRFYQTGAKKNRRATILLDDCRASVVWESPTMGIASCSVSGEGLLFGRVGVSEQSLNSCAQVQLEAEPILLPTVVKVVLAFWPRVVIAARQTTMIRANMTAYSTAVGPSSRFRKFTTASVNLRMEKSPQ